MKHKTLKIWTNFWLTKERWKEIFQKEKVKSFTIRDQRFCIEKLPKEVFLFNEET